MSSVNIYTHKNLRMNQKKEEKKKLRKIQKKRKLQKLRRNKILQTSLLPRQNLQQLPKVKLKQLRRVFSRENKQTLLYMGKGQTSRDVYTGQWKIRQGGKKKKILISLFPAFRKFPALRNDENPQEHSTK